MGRVSTITSHGYRLIFVGKQHHLSDVRGYVYEHRLIAETMLNRKLTPRDIVHHIDDDPLNNDPSNLNIITRAEHAQLHKSRLGTGSMVCGRGHVKEFAPNGDKVCRVCINANERKRYHGK